MKAGKKTRPPLASLVLVFVLVFDKVFDKVRDKVRDKVFGVHKVSSSFFRGTPRGALAYNLKFVKEGGRNERSAGFPTRVRKRVGKPVHRLLRSSSSSSSSIHAKVTHSFFRGTPRGALVYNLKFFGSGCNERCGDIPVPDTTGIGKPPLLWWDTIE